jgi:hypothetical protein
MPNKHKQPAWFIEWESNHFRSLCKDVGWIKRLALIELAAIIGGAIAIICTGG